MSTKGTLVILTPGFAASEDDSTCLPMQESLVQTWSDLYPQIRIVILSFQYPYVVKKYTWHNATVYSFGGRNRGGLRRLLLRRKILNQLTQIHENEPVVGLLSFWYNECAAVGKIFAAKHALSHCCWLLGQDARKGNRYPISHPLQARELIALSDFLREEFERNYGIEPLQVIPPGVRSEPALLPQREKDIDLLAAGSLIPLKAYDTLIDVVMKMKTVLPTIRLVLIGDGPELQPLQAMIVKHSLEENVQLTGALPHNEVLWYMQRAKLFLHPSSYEGFGVVCLEALAGGAQVISFVRPMKREIEGWHQAKSKADMAEKALSLLQDPLTYYQPKAPFCLEDTARQILSLFAAKQG